MGSKMENWKYQSFVAEGDSSETFCYQTKHNGNTVYVQFGPVKQYNGSPVYGVYLTVYRKRKQEVIAFNARSTTGSIGTTGLLLAKQSFDIFLEDFFQKTNFNSVILSIVGSDIRRYKVYKRTLGRMGYAESKILGPLCMSKIHRREDFKGPVC